MLVGQFSPGPDFLLLLKNSLNHGRRTGLFTVVGIVVGVSAHTCLALAGLSVLFAGTSSTGTLIRYLGAAYLIYLAIRLLRAKPQQVASEQTGTQTSLSPAAAFAQGLLTNLLNPKAVIFISSILTQFLSPESPLSAKWIYAAIIIGQALVFWALFVELLQIPKIRRAFLRYQRPFNLVFAALLILLALRAATG